MEIRNATLRSYLICPRRDVLDSLPTYMDCGTLRNRLSPPFSVPCTSAPPPHRLFRRRDCTFQDWIGTASTEANHCVCGWSITNGHTGVKEATRVLLLPFLLTTFKANHSRILVAMDRASTFVTLCTNLQIVAVSSSSSMLPMLVLSRASDAVAGPHIMAFLVILTVHTVNNLDLEVSAAERAPSAIYSHPNNSTGTYRSGAGALLLPSFGSDDGKE
ncbi:hypothetical protein PM082_013658 [Marasmius tenuissimus]|nr:hypothetical protein PM082_013658 [Marasmius tenuissimus]